MAERITGHTELVGLMAYPIRHSSSPAMHNEAFAYLGLDYAYLAFEVDNSTLEDAVKGIRALKLVGSKVSMPNKTVVHKYLDEVSPAAQMCGAVNTIVNDNGRLIGHITDGIGYMQSLKDYDIDVIGKKMTIAGAGGAATAIEIQAALDGVKEMSIFNIKDKFWDNAVETVKKINSMTDCKASLFEQIFHEKAEALSLYNAINGTDYSDEGALTITTISGALYMDYKNDVSFLIDSTLNLYEHQSTWNPNMPLRGLGYFARLYEDYVRLNELNIYSETRLKLPKPQYFVFYNGTKAEPDRQILKLSDSFPDDGIQPHLEVMVVALNINYGHNRELMEKCQSLHDYAVFVDTVKRYIDQGYITRRAVDMAVEECIANDILREFLVRNKTGVMRMLFGKEDSK